MQMNFKLKLLVTYLLTAFLLQACGGGGSGDDGSPDSTNDANDLTNTSQDYSGETGQATLTTDNTKQLAIASASGTKQAIDSESVPIVGARSDLPFSNQDILEEHADFLAGILEGNDSSQAARGVTAARTEDLSSVLCDSGSIIATYPDTGTSGNWSIEYDQCARTTSYGGNSYTTSFNGVVEVTYTQDGNGFLYEYRYENFTISIQSPSLNHTQTFNMSMTCEFNQDGSNYSCEYYSDYQGYDDRIYRVSEVSVSGNVSSGYNVSVRVYDPDNGYVTVTTEVPVTYECSNGYPNAGRVHVEGANGTVATVEFTSCSVYVVVFNGVANTYDWP
jgi:hypothetical protein